MAIMLYPDGARAVVSPENGRYFTLSEKCRLVPGSRHEVVFIHERWSALISARSTDVYNEQATLWMKAISGYDRPVFGPAMIFRNEEFVTDLTDGAFLALVSLERAGMA